MKYQNENKRFSMHSEHYIILVHCTAQMLRWLVVKVGHKSNSREQTWFSCYPVANLGRNYKGLCDLLTSVACDLLSRCCFKSYTMVKQIEVNIECFLICGVRTRMWEWIEWCEKTGKHLKNFIRGWQFLRFLLNGPSIFNVIFYKGDR